MNYHTWDDVQQATFAVRARRTGDQEHAYRIVLLDLSEHRVEVPQQRAIDRVEPLRAVERDDRDAVLGLLVAQRLVAHVQALAGMRSSRSLARRSLPASSRSGWSTNSNVRGSL